MDLPLKEEVVAANPDLKAEEVGEHSQLLQDRINVHGAFYSEELFSNCKEVIALQAAFDVSKDRAGLASKLCEAMKSGLLKPLVVDPGGNNFALLSVLLAKIEVLETRLTALEKG